MNTTTLIVIVSTALIISLALRFILQPRVRRISPRKRYTIFAVLLGVGVSSQIVGLTVSAVHGKLGLAALFFFTFLGLTGACVLEMRKLSREF